MQAAGRIAGRLASFKLAFVWIRFVAGVDERSRICNQQRLLFFSSRRDQVEALQMPYKPDRTFLLFCFRRLSSCSSTIPN
ncbi:MAG TPA: hypothetical protein PKW57_03245, partial [Anaerolineaceae bacterium]|nr:hypothetical protein [Anaerolineaceae bacterium]